MASDLFGTPYIATEPYILPNLGVPSGSAEIVGPAESALFDGSDDTYALLYSGTPSDSGSTAAWLDGLYVTLLADITELQVRLSYTNPVPEAFNDAGRTIFLWTSFSDRVGLMFLDGPGGDIQDLTFTFDPPLRAGQTLLIYSETRAGDVDVKFPTIIYQIGPVTAPVAPTDAPVPWLRVYPRHDQRLYPPTRSLGARPAGYP